MMEFGWEFWVIVGLVAIIIDVALGLEFFALSFGVGAVIVGVLVFSETIDMLNIGNWKAQLLVACIIGLGVAFPIRTYAKKSTSNQDINDY